MESSRDRGGKNRGIRNQIPGVPASFFSSYFLPSLAGFMKSGTLGNVCIEFLHVYFCKNISSSTSSRPQMKTRVLKIIFYPSDRQSSASYLGAARRGMKNKKRRVQFEAQIKLLLSSRLTKHKHAALICVALMTTWKRVHRG